MQSIKTLLGILAFFLAAFVCRAQAPGWPYQQFVQSQAHYLDSATNTVTPDLSVTSGNNIYLLYKYETGTTSPVCTDTLSTSFTTQLNNTTNTERVAVITGTASSSGADVVSCTSTAARFTTLVYIEMPPLWNLTIDASAISTFSGTPASMTTPNVTTTTNTDLILSWVAISGILAGANPDSTTLGKWFQHGSADGSGAAAWSVGGTNGSQGSMKWVNVGGSLGTLLTVSFSPSGSLTINSPTTSPNGDTTHSYSYTLLASGGVGAYTWSVSGGTLPSGLSLNSSTGAITGTPTVSNHYTTTFQVTDGTHTATKVIHTDITTGLGAITFVQGNSVFNTSGTTSLQFQNSSGNPTNVTAGDLIVVVGDVNQGDGNMHGACTDTLGTTYQSITWFNVNDNSGILVLTHIWAGIAPSTGHDTVACGTSGSITLNNVSAIAEFSNASMMYDDNILGTIGATTPPATITSNAITTLVPNEGLISVCTLGYLFGNAAIQSPFTQIFNPGHGASATEPQTAYDVVTTVTTYTASCVTSGASNPPNGWLVALAGFRPGNGTVVPPVNKHHILFDN